MWEAEFSNRKAWLAEKQAAAAGPFQTRLRPSDISGTSILYWREHCLECSPPGCYNTCPLYEERRDRRCVRLRYGIYPNRHFSGALGFGADVRFKRWAKLGTIIYPGLISPGRHKLLQQLDFAAVTILHFVFRITNPFNILQWVRTRPYNPQRFLYKTYSYFREMLLDRLTEAGAPAEADCMVVECFNFEDKPFRMHMEMTDRMTFFKDSFEIRPGRNYLEVPLSSIGRGKTVPRGSIIVYPENDLEARVVFTWLDFVKKRESLIGTVAPQAPAEKVKCVAWDLDNTLWKGVLIEDGPEKVVVSPAMKEMIRKLDERGIIQTVVSKNDHGEAWRIIEENGLGDYFIYPAINWGPKSANLRKVAEKININIDTFALVDDSAFERAEVSSSLPQVRVYTEKEALRLLEYPEFDVPVTQASSQRRISYLTEMQRDRALEEFGPDYIGFLKSCRMVLKVFTPMKEKEVARCLELIQRSNQLNLSSKRYTAPEFQELLRRDDVSCFALESRDRFGEYGIVGFASVCHGKEEASVQDFVISCRVAQKRVEHTFFEWLGSREKGFGRKTLSADLIKTKKNGPLVRVFHELPFKPVSDTEERISFELDLQGLRGPDDVITLEDCTGGGEKADRDWKNAG